MSQIIDCFFIGHNETPFYKHQMLISSMGSQSGTYRELTLEYVKYKGEPYTINEIFNSVNEDNQDSNYDTSNFEVSNIFSNTIAYLATYLSRRGFTFDFISSFNNEQGYLISKLKENKIRTVVISTTLYLNIYPIAEIIELIRRYNKSVRIVVGGPLISAVLRSGEEHVHQIFLKAIGADIFVNSDQGEGTLVKVIEALRENQSLDTVPNIYYKNADTYFKTSSTREKNILDQNMVEWNLFEEQLKKVALVRTAVSCPFSCSYCAHPIYAGEYYTAGLEAIEQELDSLHRSKIQRFMFIDDTFNIPPIRFKEILKLMIRKEYNFKWSSFFRCQFADEEMVRLMYESGCECVYLGIESGSDMILKNMNKATTVDKYRRGIELLKKYDFIIFTSFIVGFPGETYETIQETVNFIKETQPDYYCLSLWYFAEMTPIWNEREKYGIEGSGMEWTHSTMSKDTACDLIEEIFLEIKESTNCPKFGFDMPGAINMLSRGIDKDKLKRFIQAYNNGVRRRLENPMENSIDDFHLEEFKNILNS